MSPIDRRSVLLGATAALFACRSGGTDQAGLRARAGTTQADHASATEFLRAVEVGDEPRVASLLTEHPALLSSRDGAGRSAFVLAALAGHDGVCRILVDSGLKLDIVEAVLAEDWDRVNALAAEDPELANRAHPIGGSPLYAGALAGVPNLWRLRRIGCDPDGRPAGGNGFSPARGAMDARTEGMAIASAVDILGNGGDVQAQQRGADSILHGAVRRRSEALVRLAVRKGANVDARDDAGRTARGLAQELEWAAGVALLANPARLPRDHRRSRFAFDVDRNPMQRVELADVPQDLQNVVTGASHVQFDVAREHLERDPRLTFSRSVDDEFAIEAAGHIGNRPIIALHLERGSPYALPTAISAGDADHVRFLLDGDPLLVHERGAHDFPVMWFVVMGGGDVEMAELLHARGVGLDQESAGTTALHQCVVRSQPDLARWLVEKGAAIDAVGYRFSVEGDTPLGLALRRGNGEMARLLRQLGATAG